MLSTTKAARHTAVATAAAAAGGGARHRRCGASAVSIGWALSYRSCAAVQAEAVLLRFHFATAVLGAKKVFAGCAAVGTRAGGVLAGAMAAAASGPEAAQRSAKPGGHTS